MVSNWRMYAWELGIQYYYFFTGQQRPWDVLAAHRLPPFLQIVVNMNDTALTYDAWRLDPLGPGLAIFFVGGIKPIPNSHFPYGLSVTPQDHP